jgi:ribosome-associated toxin RatA of RatAB toxin-antitoxin module
LAQAGLGRAQAEDALAAPRITLRQEGMILVVEGWLQTRADQATAWAVLTDYAHFPEFVPGVTHNQVLAAENGHKTIAQRGQVMAGQVRVPYEGLVDVMERPHEGMDILFLSGPLKDLRGAWRMIPGSPLKLSYSMHMDLSRTPFPPPLAPAIAQQQVSVWVEMFGREIERRAGK